MGNDKLIKAMDALIRYVERNECTHEETYRGGAIWTICRSCDRKWADDEGGFTPYEEPKEIEHARAALAVLRSQDLVIAPREPTEVMLEASGIEATEYYFQRKEYAHAWLREMYMEMIDVASELKDEAP